MLDTSSGKPDKCPRCGQLQMPPWNPMSKSEDARKCQNKDCGLIERKTIMGPVSVPKENQH